MSNLVKLILVTGLVIAIHLPSSAQFFITPQANVGLPVGTAEEYATAQLGYGVQAGYQFTNRWSVVVGYDKYQFEVSAALEELTELNSIFTSLLNLPEFLSVDMTAQVWNGGFRYSVPYQGLIPFFGLSASTNQLKVEGFGISISRRYWGLSPIIGAELPLSDNWGIQADARLQTIFIRDNIPFVEEIIKEHLVFVPVQVGVIFHLDQSF